MVASDDKDEARSEYEEIRTSDASIPPIDFNILVLSLSTSALMQMGEGPQGDSGEPDSDEPDLDLARQTIDLLGVLEEKTRGNLTGEEERLLHQVLNDLRMRFVRKQATA